jgi:hypothetical protein
VVAQASQHFAARWMQLQVAQFGLALGAQGRHGTTQGDVGVRKGCWF